MLMPQSSLDRGGGGFCPLTRLKQGALETGFFYPIGASYAAGLASPRQRFYNPDTMSEYPNPPVLPVEETEQNETLSFGKALWLFLVDVLETLVLAVVMFMVINSVTARVRVDGHSMDPTLQNGEFIIVNRLAYRFGQPSRGDIIVFNYPKNPTQQFIKRVIGLPGDTVHIEGGRVYVNGTPLEEPYIAAPPQYTGTWTVPEGQLFVLGDNRNQSSDSHAWGTLPLDLVVGKAVFVYWPLDQVGWINHTRIVSAAP